MKDCMRSVPGSHRPVEPRRSMKRRLAKGSVDKQTRLSLPRRTSCSGLRSTHKFRSMQRQNPLSRCGPGFRGRATSALATPPGVRLPGRRRPPPPPPIRGRRPARPGCRPRASDPPPPGAAWEARAQRTPRVRPRSGRRSGPRSPRPGGAPPAPPVAPGT